MEDMQKRRWIAWWMSVSVLMASILSPLSCQAQGEAAEWNRYGAPASEGISAGSDSSSASAGAVSGIASGGSVGSLPSPSADVGGSEPPLDTIQPAETPDGSAEPGETPETSSQPTVSPAGLPTVTAVSTVPAVSTPPAVSTGPAVSPPVRPVMTPVPGANFLLGADVKDRLSMTIGASGIFDIDRSRNSVLNSSDLKNLTRMAYQSENSSVLQVDAVGNYKAVGIGKTDVTMIGYGGNQAYYDEKGRYIDYYREGEQKLFSKTYTIYVYPDMSTVVLAKNSVTIYRVKGYYKSSKATIAITSDYLLDEGDEITYVSAVSSNKKMYVDCSVNKNILTMRCDESGQTDVAVTINNREFQVHLKVVVVRVPKTSYLLARHKTAKVKAKGYSGKLKWKSSNPSVASVNKKGKIRAKKEGNAIISVKISGCKIGCVVSVVTARKKRTIQRAKHIGKTCKYSQPKRMKKGYYDCSSLVWRSYAAFGVKVASRSGAPTAATMAQWCAGRHKLLKGGYSRKNVQKLKIKAGDLMFETGAKNGRYMGIYHVEMFAGYELYGFNSKGKALVIAKWANRPDGYYAYGVGIVGKM